MGLLTQQLLLISVATSGCGRKSKGGTGIMEVTGRKKEVFKAKYLLSKSTGQNLMRNGKASRSNLIMWDGRRKRFFRVLNHRVSSETIPRVKLLAWNCKV